MFARCQFRPLSHGKHHLPGEERTGGRTGAQVHLKGTGLIIPKATAVTLNCIFQLGAAGTMMAPHSKLNQTCTQKQKRASARKSRPLSHPIG